MKKTSKVILTSILTIVACVSLIAGATFALFTSESKTNIAITSAKVDLKANISKVEMKSELPGEKKDYAPMGSVSLDGNKLTVSNMAPGDYVTFDLTFDNQSTIATKWQLQITTDAKDEADKEFFKQLNFTTSSLEIVDTGNAQLTNWQPLAAGVAPDSLNVHIQLPDSTEKQTDSKNLSIIITVYAVQGNAPTVKPVAEVNKVTDTLYIYTVEEFKEFAQQSKRDPFTGKTVLLMESLDLNNEPWTTYIGGANGFNGTFDGQGLTISNLYINAPTEKNVGLFSRFYSYGGVHDGVIKGLTLSNVNVTGEQYVGALMGGIESTDSIIDNCHVTGLIKIQANYAVAAIEGFSYDNISNSTVTGSTGSYIRSIYNRTDLEGDNVGGICGFSGESCIYSNCHVSGVTIEGTRKVGGVLGYLHSSSTVTGCSFTDGTLNVTAVDAYIESKGIAMITVGGIVGQTHITSTTRTITDNSVRNITINAPKSYTFETVTNDQVLNSAILGNARECNTQDGMDKAKTIEASGNTYERVTFNALLNDVRYSLYNGAFISNLRVHSVQDIVNIRALQADGTLKHNAVIAGENHTVVYFDEGVYDLSGIEWTPFDGGRFDYIADGDVTIRNMNMTSAQWRGGFVDSAADCTIRGFTFENGTLIGEQVGIVAGHADQPAKIENVTLKGNISVSYGDAPSYSEDAPGIGVFYGVITSDADTLTKAVIDENCVVNLYLNDIVPHSSLNFVDNNYLLGYAYNDATTAINPGCNIKGHIYANIVDGLRMVAHEDLRYYFEASTIEGYNKFVSSYANEHVGTIFRKQVGSIITYEERFHLNIAQDIDFHDQVVAPIDSNRVEIDGHGHTLSNIKFGYDGNDKSGLVGNPGSPISNLTLRNVRSEGSQAGAFAGLSSGLALTNCRLEGKVEIIYNDLPDTPRKEDYPGIGAFVGIMSEGTLSFDNVVLASDANVTLDFNGLKANEASKSISFLAGYHAGGTVTGEPTQEEGSNVEVKGLANLSSSGSIPSYPDNGMDFNDGTITIDGTTDATDDHRMLVEVKHTAFNHFDGLEGITSGKIVIKNVHFFREIDGRDDGYALTLGFDANVEVVFENCTFENMYCAIYCNRNETGKVNISFTNCTFTNTDYLYCYDNSGVEGTINVQYDSETAKTINENKLHD